MAAARRPLEVVALFALVACGPVGPNPDQGRCDTPAATGDVAELELGAATDGAFRPLADGEVVALVTGGQGVSMLPYRLRARGAAVPACLELDLRALPGGVGEDPLASMRTGLAMSGSGSERVSESSFFLLDFICRGSPLRLRAQSYGASVEHTVLADRSDGIAIVALRSARPSYRVGETVVLELETNVATDAYSLDLYVDGMYRLASPIATSTTVAQLSFVADRSGTLAVEVSVACQRAHLDVTVTP